MSAATTTPPTPPTSLPAFARVTSASILQRNASTSSSRSTTTSESTSSLVAVPIRPPPIQTRTTATPEAQLPSEGTPSYDLEPSGGYYGGRGFIHNGPRMARQATMPVHHSLPHLITDDDSMPERSVSVPPHASRSPTTPRASHRSLDTDSAPQLPLPVSPGPLSLSYDDGSDSKSEDKSDTRSDIPTPSRGRQADSCPPTPSTARSGPRRRDHSADSSTVAPSERTERERRPSHASANSTASSARARPSTRDFILGEELGRGSYSTVVHAVYSPLFLANNPRPANAQFAIKIMNQAHLIQEKKAKYAHIERDALIRLAQPSRTLGVRGHQRGLSSSSGHSGVLRKGGASGGAPSVGTSLPTIGVSEVSSSSLVSPTPMSPRLSTSRRLRGDGQEVLDERPPPSVFSSRPPSPVQEEEDGSSDTGNLSESLSSSGGRDTAPEISAGSAGERARTPRKRRQSLAPSERSTRSARSGKSTAGSVVVQQGHPGIVRLYSTFADRTSVYFVLEYASNGELAQKIRKFGSLDVNSARYYAALLIDTLEFIHERDIIHRDLKPENILLDDDMRIKVTDFGSAKILGRNGEKESTSKRSFVGSADYVSPEVLRDEPASFASDIWAFGVVLYDFIYGKSPFRSATEFLTFQKVLKRELSFPEGFDETARDLVELALNLDPTKRPTAQALKSHPFFAGIDWNNLWSIPAPKMHTGMTPPVKTLDTVQLSSDAWTVFDEEESENEVLEESGATPANPREPQYDRVAAAKAVRAVDNQESSPRSSDDIYQPPRPGWLDEEGVARPNFREHKARGWSTSSSSSGGRLSGLLETMGINPAYTPPGHRATSNRGGPSRASGRSDDQSVGHSGVYPRSPRSPRSPRMRHPNDAKWGLGVATTDNSRWTPLLFPHERVVLSTPILAKPSNGTLPSFLLPPSKRRQLVLTDLPRLLVIKEDEHTNAPKVKTEFFFVTHGKSIKIAAQLRKDGSAPAGEDDDRPVNIILELHEKGNRMFLLQTATQAFTYATETPDVRSAWMHALKRLL